MELKALLQAFHLPRQMSQPEFIFEAFACLVGAPLRRRVFWISKGTVVFLGSDVQRSEQSAPAALLHGRLGPALPATGGQTGSPRSTRESASARAQRCRDHKTCSVLGPELGKRQSPAAIRQLLCFADAAFGEVRWCAGSPCLPQ